MPMLAFPTRYRQPKGGLISPAVLTPPDEDTSPAFDPQAMQSQSLQDAPPLPPQPDEIPKPPQLNDTQAGASLEKLPPLNPEVASRGSMPAFSARNSAVMPPPGAAPAANVPAIQAAPAAPSPPAGGPPDSAAVAKSALQDVAANQKKLTSATPPDAPKSNWAQRLGLAILSMTKLAPAANQIIHPKWSEEEHAYERGQKDIQEKLKGSETALSAATLGEQREATAAQRLNLGQDYAIKEENRAQAVKDRIAAQTPGRNQKFLADRLKGRESDASYQSADTPKPPGWDFIEDPEKPGFGFAVPPAWRAAPQELLPYLPGSKVGDMISHQEFKAASDALNKENLERTKADVKPVKPTITPETREALIATGAVDVDNPTQPEMEKALQRVERKHVSERPVTNTNITNLTSDAVDQNAQRYLETGELPSLGMGQAGNASRTAILNRAAQMGGGQNLSQNKLVYGAQRKLEADFTSGKSAQNIRSLNTLTGHLGTLNDMAEALQNNDVQTYNALANRLSKELGDPRVTNFDLAKAAVTGEMATAFKGNATDPEIATWSKAISGAGSPAQLKGAIRTPLSLMHSRFSAFQNQYQTLMGKPFKMLSPEARATLQKMGYDPNEIEPQEVATTGGRGGPAPAAGARPPLSSFEGKK